MTRVDVLPHTPSAYPVFIEAGAISRALPVIAKMFGNRRLFLVVDRNAQSHAAPIIAAAERTVVLEPGEISKTWMALGKTLDQFLAARIDRQSLVIAFGGGVTGDHAGFAAAIALRGIDFVQIPTTLLAQVDSSVGGKTGINSPHGKNLIGAFHQPKLVLIDPAALSTLPDREMRAGYAEVVKYAFIGNEKFFDWLEKNGRIVLAKDAAALEHAVAVSVQSKAAIVEKDERETGDLRALLNFGHTFAHALEAACEYDRRLLHGEAVAVGMSLAFGLSARMGLCSMNDAERAIAHMAAMGLPTGISMIRDFPPLPAARLMEMMAGDKKARDGRLRMVLTRGIGRAFVTSEIDMDALAAVLERG